MLDHGTKEPVVDDTTLVDAGTGTKGAVDG